MKNKRRLQYFLVVTLFLLFVNNSFAQKPIKPNKSPAAQHKLNEQEKKDIIEFVFNDGLVNFDSRINNPNLKNCVFSKHDEKQSVIVSTEDLEDNFIPKIEGYEFKLMPLKDILKTAEEKQQRICYLQVSSFNVKEKAVYVSFWFTLRKFTYIYGTSFLYRFKEVKGQWVGEFVNARTLES